MTRLTITYPLGAQPRGVDEDDEVFLDRLFLSEGSDDSLSRAPHAPSLRHMDGRWWLVNASPQEEPVTVFAEGRRFAVGERCAFPLPDGASEVYLWSPRYRVGLVVEGVPREVSAVRGAGTPTQLGLPESVERVQDLFHRKPLHKVALAAHYREYFTPGIGSPAPQDRSETAKCLGRDTVTTLERALNETMEAAWGETQGHRHELPMFLRRKGLLVERDQGLVPHRRCGGHGA